jgi:thymidylate synthase ThyX
MISAKVIADSINEYGNRLTTVECEYPRFIHGEVMTHRMFSRNAQSSRAVPVGSTINANKRYVKPLVWGLNKAGMSSVEVLTPLKQSLAAIVWNTTASVCFGASWLLSKIGLHKQWANRITEPFSNIKVIITATEFDNFFWLRIDEKAAQPEIVGLAKAIKLAMDISTPEQLQVGQYHLPYINMLRLAGADVYYDSKWSELTLEEAQKISASCCAQISYRKLNDSKEKAIEIYERLFSGDKPHLSPVEHQATPVKPLHFAIQGLSKKYEGVTHLDHLGNPWSGNLKGWIQYRQVLENSLTGSK